MTARYLYSVEVSSFQSSADAGSDMLDMLTQFFGEAVVEFVEDCTDHDDDFRAERFVNSVVAVNDDWMDEYAEASDIEEPPLQPRLGGHDPIVDLYQPRWPA